MRFSHPRLVWRMYCEEAASWNANTRLRPCSLAEKQAESASLKMADRLCENLVIATTPMLTPTWKFFSPHSNCQPCTASRSRVAVVCA